MTAADDPDDADRAEVDRSDELQRSDEVDGDGEVEHGDEVERVTRQRRSRRRGTAAGRQAEPDADGDASETRPGRRERRRQERRGRRRRAIAVLTGLLLLAGGGWLVWDQVQGSGTGSAEPTGEPLPAALPDVAHPVLTVVTVADGAPTSIAVLGFERGADRGTVVPIPPATQAPVPGVGSGTLLEAYELGGPASLGDALALLLRVRSDAVAEVPADAWDGAVAALGADPEVATRLRGDPEEPLADLLAVGEAYLELLDRTAANSQELRAALEAGGATRDDAGLVEAMLTVLSGARATDDVAAEVLPIAGVAEDTGLVAPDQPAITALVLDRFAAAHTPDDVGDGVALQVLDGNGVEGVLDMVAQVLEPVGYELLLTGNADRDDHEVTRIVIHGDDQDTLRAARDVRDRLGVGTIERAGTPLSVVDVTVVVGLDFPVGTPAS